MSEIKPDENFIKTNYDKTISLIKKITKSEDSDIQRLIEFFGDRYAVCPASSNKEFYSAFPGGLAYHNLHILTWMGRFANLMGLDKEYSTETLLKVSLLAQIGKLGNLEQDYYIPAKNKWQIDKGIFYDINPDISFLRIPQRSLFLASNFGIKLSEDEYIAILLFEGQGDDSNSQYKYKENKLALALQYAIRWAQKLEKENIVHYP